MISGESSQSMQHTEEPVETVSVETEEPVATHNDHPEESIVEIDDEDGDQQQPEKKKLMSGKQAYSAWKKEKDKRKAKQQQIMEMEKQNEMLQTQINDLRNQVKVAYQSKRPDPMQFATADEFYAALAKWEEDFNAINANTPAKEKSAPIAQKGTVSSMNDRAEYHLFDAEHQMRKVYPNYDEARNRSSDILNTTFNAPEGVDVAVQLANYAHVFQVDPAKVFVAIEKMPDKVEELQRIANDPSQIGQWLKTMENKVKIGKPKQPANTATEPNIKSKGTMSPLEKSLEQAKKHYQAEPSLVNHRKLREIRERIRKQNK